MFNSPDPVAIAEERVAYHHWHNLSTIEESFLKQKAKIHWLDVGDQNSKYFHQCIRERKMRSMIWEITNANGETLTKQDELKSEAAGFFKDFLNATPENFSGMSVDQLTTILNFRCSEMDKATLMRDVTEEEIQKKLIFNAK